MQDILTFDELQISPTVFSANIPRFRLIGYRPHALQMEKRSARANKLTVCVHIDIICYVYVCACMRSCVCV